MGNSSSKVGANPNGGASNVNHHRGANENPVQQNHIETSPLFSSEFAANEEGRNSAFSELVQYPYGTYLFRRSVSQPGQYTLSVHMRQQFGNQCDNFSGISFDSYGNILFRGNVYPTMGHLMQHLVAGMQLNLRYPINTMREVRNHFVNMDQYQISQRMYPVLAAFTTATVYTLGPSNTSNVGFQVVYGSRNTGVQHVILNYDQANQRYFINLWSTMTYGRTLLELLQNTLPNAVSLKVLEKQIADQRKHQAKLKMSLSRSNDHDPPPGFNLPKPSAPPM